MLILSVVSGTYNRLPHLQGMVQSVRKSVGRGMPYEIVLVDGGSTDGTLEWCRSQGDIVLIEQGELLGAVKAFNAGFEKATGEYVIAANDDITFVDESLACAIRFMQDNPDVGCGCFWQDRGGRDWHLEYMPAILDGKQISHIYGQVAIYPRWLGDKVGWWGTYLHTYGGDNELSCHIMELGYKVRGIPCACIHDNQVYDELRKINNEIYNDPSHVARKGKPLNDSLTWGRHWQHKGTYKGMTGPIVKADGVAVSNIIDRHSRVLYMPIYEPGHPVQKESKKGLREALSQIGLVYEYDYVGMCQTEGKGFGVDYTFDIADVWKPHLFVFQIQGVGEYTVSVLAELRAEHLSAVFVNWNGDYHTEVLYSRQYMDLLKQFHLTGLITTTVAEKYAQEGIPWFYWQIGYEESVAEPLPATPKHDVVFLANGYSEVRFKLVRQLRKLKCNVGIYGNWPAQYKPNGDTLYDFDAGQRLYRAAKFAISDNQWGESATGFVSNRLFQAMAAGGALFLQQYFDGMELLGLRDGEHLVVWHDFQELRDKIHYYMKHEDKRKAIADAGTAEILENHSFDVRVMELLDELRVRGLWPMSP